MGRHHRARAALIVSMAVFGTLAVFVRNIPLASGELALYRAVLAAMLIGVYLGIAKARTRGKREAAGKGLGGDAAGQEGTCARSAGQEGTCAQRAGQEGTCAQRAGQEGTCARSAGQEGAWAGEKEQGRDSRRRELLLLLLSGFAMGINWILLFQAYRFTTVSVATLSYYFAPVLVTVASPLLFHEKLTGRQVFCFLMSTAGVVMIVGVGGLGNSASDLTGILFGLGAAVFYASVILLNKFIRQVAGIERTFLQFLAAILILVPYVACTGGFHLGTLSSVGWVNLLIVGLFHTGVTYCLYFSSLKELRGQEAAVLSYIDPLVAVVVSVLVLGEAVTVWQIVGGGLILGFAILNEREQA